MNGDLPIFKYGDILSRDPSFLQRLRHTCHHTGFFYLCCPELAEGPLKLMFDQAQKFFALPATEKNAIHLSRSRHFRGYSLLDEEKTQGASDHKETLDLGLECSPSDSETAYQALQGPNQWPSHCRGFREAIESYITQLCSVGKNIIRSLALCLGLEENTFARHFTPSHCMLRLIAYPPVEPDSRIDQGIGDHTDFGCLTILAQDEVGGLEVQLTDGKWIKAKPRSGCLVVNLGDMLEVWTAHYFMATPHRVRCPRGSSTRYSIPFFFEPNLDTMVKPLSLDCLPPFERPVSTIPSVGPIRYGEHMLEAFHRSYPGVVL
ncbi:MAG TPA: hypothetical protein DIV54_00850 [Verrucomicrobiales bacterium]|nr:hypothetical protein [Verrucomicrobiales bacterium]